MAKIKKPFLDANILFTAAYNPEGLAALLINRQHVLKVKILTSSYAVEEATYNLRIKAPESLSRLEQLLDKIEVLNIKVDESFNPLQLPKEDQPIFQGALSSHATHLLTGDKKAFGKWMNKPEATFGLKIQTIRDFFDSL